MPIPANTSLKSPLVIIMVGLPARGKTYTAQRLQRFLLWRGYQSRVFNVGNTRRAQVGAQVPHNFFDRENAVGLTARRAAAESTLDALLEWCALGGQVAIYDATNTTRSRRNWVKIACEERGLRVLWFEITCADATVIDTNIRASKLSNPDYKGIDPEAAVADFRARIAHYERAYEPLAPEEGSHIRLHDLGQRIELFDIHGYLQGKLVSLAMNLHTVPRPIYLSRHGQSEDNRQHKLGGDSNITNAGKAYAQKLAQWFQDRDKQSIQIWTSTLRRTIQTAVPLSDHAIALKSLDEIHAGICEGMTYEQVREQMPREFQARKEDKLGYRYPQGESYEDVIERLEPIIFELERQREPVLVIAHQAILRALYGYFTNRTRSETPHIEIPLHTLIRITPRAYGYDEERVIMGPEVPQT